MLRASLVLLLGASAQLAGAAPPGVWALTNARVVPAPGRVLERGTILVRDGLVEAVGASVPVPAEATVLDLKGKTVYPGLVDAHVTLSRLAGKAPERPDEDDGSDPSGGSSRRETPERPSSSYPVPGVRPERSALPELVLSPEVRRTLRSLGFTAVAAVPDDGLFRGQAAVVSLGDRPLAGSVLSSSAGQVVSLAPDRRAGEGAPTSRMGTLALARRLVKEARWSAEAEAAAARSPGRRRPDRQPAWRALGGVVSGAEPLVFETQDVLSFLEAGRLSRELGVAARFVGALDAWRLAREVRELRPDLVLSLAFPAVPSVDDDDDWLDVPLETLRAWDRAPSNPRWMRDLGLQVAFTTHGLPELSDLPARVAKARARGLSAEDLLAGLTTVPARMLGLSQQLGEIAPGRPANLVVVEGRLLETGARVVETWVDGVAYPVAARTAAPSGRYRAEGLELEFRREPSSGSTSVLVTPPSAETAERATSVSRQEGALAFDADGAWLGLAPGPVRVTARATGESLDLTVARGAERVRKRGERAPRAPRPGTAEEAVEAETSRAAPEAPDSDVRPLPSRHGGPLAEPKGVLVRGAEVFTQGPQGTLSKGDLLVVDGKVAAVGPSVEVPPLISSSVLVVDGTGLAVTPGLVDAHSHTAVDGNVNETGRNVSAETRILDVLDPFDPNLYRELAGGLTTAHVLHGSANTIGGQDAVLKLKWGEGPASLPVPGAPPGIKMAMGENPRGANWRGGRDRFPRTRMGVAALLRERFAAAREYRRKQQDESASRALGEDPVPVRPDPELEAIAEVLEGTRRIHAHAYVKQEILDLLRACEEEGVKVATLQHALDAYKVADEIAAHGAGASVFSDWWAYKLEVFDAIPWNAPLLLTRGVLVSYNSDSDELARRMNLEAAKAVKYGGLSREAALSLVTSSPARQLGVEGRVGSLEPGKDGDFVLWSGDPLDTGTVCLETWIEGKRLFDRKADLAARAHLAAEKADLVARAVREASRGEETSSPARSRRPERGCLDAEEAAE